MPRRPPGRHAEGRTIPSCPLQMATTGGTAGATRSAPNGQGQRTVRQSGRCGRTTSCVTRAPLTAARVSTEPSSCEASGLPSATTRRTSDGPPGRERAGEQATPAVPDDRHGRAGAVGDLGEAPVEAAHRGLGAVDVPGDARAVGAVADAPQPVVQDGERDVPGEEPRDEQHRAPSPCGMSCPRQVSLTSSRASSRCTRASPNGRPHQRSGGGSSATFPTLCERCSRL